MNPEIRFFTPGDSDAAAELHQVCFPEDPWPAAAFTSLLACQSSGFGAWLGQQLVGLILVRPAADEAEILTFAVNPAFRRQGLGATLLIHAMGALQKKLVAIMYLEVAEQNHAARLLYEKLGFKIIGQRDGYYNHKIEPESALVMSISLKENNQ